MLFNEPNDINLYQTKSKIDPSEQSQDLGRYINLTPIIQIKNQAHQLVSLSSNYTDTRRSQVQQSRLITGNENPKELSQDQRAYIQDRLNQSKASMLSKRSVQSNKSIKQFKKETQIQISKMINIQEPIEESTVKQELDNSELMTYAGQRDYQYNWGHPTSYPPVESSGEPNNFNNTGKQRNRINTGSTILERAKFAAQEQSEPIEIQMDSSLNLSHTPYKEDDIEIIPEEDSQSYATKTIDQTMQDDRKSIASKRKFSGNSPLQVNQQMINNAFPVVQQTQASHNSGYNNYENTSISHTSVTRGNKHQSLPLNDSKQSYQSSSKNNYTKFSPKQIHVASEVIKSQSPLKNMVQNSHANKYYKNSQNFAEQRNQQKQKPFTEEKKSHNMQLSIVESSPKNQTITIQRPQKKNLMMVSKGIPLPMAAKLEETIKSRDNQSQISDFIEIEGFKIPDQIYESSQNINKNKRMQSFGQTQKQSNQSRKNFSMNSTGQNGQRGSQLVVLEAPNAKKFLKRGEGKTIGNLHQAQQKYSKQHNDQSKNQIQTNKTQSYNSQSKNAILQHQNQKGFQVTAFNMNSDLKTAEYDNFNNDYISVNIKNKKPASPSKRRLQIPSHIRQQSDNQKPGKDKQKIGYQIHSKFYGNSKMQNRPQSAMTFKNEAMENQQKPHLKMTNQNQISHNKNSHSEMKFYQNDRQMQLSNKNQRTKSPTQMQFQPSTQSKEKRLQRQNSKSKDRERDILKSNSKKDIHTVITTTVNNLIDQSKFKDQRFSHQPNRQQEVRRSMPAYTVGANIQSTRSNHSLSTNQMAFSQKIETPGVIEQSRQSAQSFQAQLIQENQMKILPIGNSTPNPQLAYQIHDHNKRQNKKPQQQRQQPMANMNTHGTNTSHQFQIESSRYSNQFSSQPRNYSREFTEQAKRVSQISINPRFAAPLSQHNGPLSPAINSPSSMGSDNLRTYRQNQMPDRPQTNFDNDTRHNVALTSNPQINGSRLISSRSKYSSQERLFFNQTQKNKLQSRQSDHSDTLMDDGAIQTKRYFSPDPIINKNQRVQILNKQVVQSSSKQNLRRASSMLDDMKLQNKQQLNQNSINQVIQDKNNRRRQYESVPSQRHNFGDARDDDNMSIQSPKSNQGRPKSMKSYLGSSQKSLKMGIRNQTKGSIERSMFHPQGTISSNYNPAQKVQDQFYNNSFNRVGKKRQESQSSANESTSQQAQMTQSVQPASSRFGGQSKYQQDINQTLNLENDSFLQPKGDQEHHQALQPYFGDSLNNLSAIQFKGDQSTIKMQTPLNPMLRTIKSEFEEDDDHIDKEDEATLEMQFPEETSPQKLNQLWQGQNPNQIGFVNQNGMNSQDMSSQSSPIKRSVNHKFIEKQTALKVQHQNYFQDKQGSSPVRVRQNQLNQMPQKLKVDLNESHASNVSTAFKKGQLVLEKSPNWF